MKRVLVVVDSDVKSRHYRIAYKTCDLDIVQSLEEALKMTEDFKYDAIVLDWPNITPETEAKLLQLSGKK